MVVPMVLGITNSFILLDLIFGRMCWLHLWWCVVLCVHGSLASLGSCNILIKVRLDNSYIFLYSAIDASMIEVHLVTCRSLVDKGGDSLAQYTVRPGQG